MVVIEHGAPFARAPEFSRRRLLQLGIAGALAAGMVAATSVADARTTQIEITSRTLAFGGYSFAGVGQYEKIIGIAHGEIDPFDAKNAVITDIQLAPRNANGKVDVLAQFLHPEAARPEQGQPQGDVRAAEPRRQDVRDAEPQRRRQRSGGPITDPAVLANSFLWPRGYTTVVERLGETSAPLTRPHRDGAPCRSRTIPTARRSPARRTNTSSPAQARSRSTYPAAIR